MLLKAELKDRMTEWGKSQDMPEMEVEGMKRPADARRLIFSCPKGSDPEAVEVFGVAIEGIKSIFQYQICFY